MRSLALVACVVLGGGDAARAEDKPDPAWSLYDRAYASLAHGDRATARAQLQQLVATYPADHPAVAFAHRQLEALDAAAPNHVQDQDAEETSTGPSKEARGELVFWTTAASTYVAYNLCNLVGCEDARETALTYTGVLGGTLAATYFASATVHQGQAQLYNSAQSWGAWTSLALWDHGLSKAASAGAIAMQAAGIGLAAGLWEVWRPSRGDVALANSAFLWGTALGMYGQIATTNDAGLRTTVLIGDAAIAIGAGVSTQIHMSRGRTLLIDSGGVAGSLLGLVVAVASSPKSDAEVAGILGGGTIAGLVIATYATMNWDGPDLPSATVAPMPLVDPATQKTTLGLGASLRF